MTVDYSRDYVCATVAISGVVWVIRYGRMVYNGINHNASLEIVGDRMVKVRVPIPKIKWTPGQHFFVRFTGTGIHSLTSHPFTVSTLPGSGAMEFVIRPQSGLTNRLAALADNSRSMGVVLDGPYGGIRHDISKYESVLLLAGGSGLYFTLVPNDFRSRPF
jgi:NAD(P)H-flavin reductase